jgi:tetratricopeptide (TPR) repeat protein
MYEVEAKALLERALAIREKALGPEHPDVATSLNNLALVHHATGGYEEAKALHERALVINEKALGPEHLLPSRWSGWPARSSGVRRRLHQRDADPGGGRLLRRRRLDVRGRGNRKNHPVW